MVSYADFITLLFAFFTTLYAAYPAESKSAPAPPARGNGVLPGDRGLLDVRKSLGDVLQTTDLRVTDDRRGLVLSIPEAGAFPAGSADLSPAAMEVIARIAAALKPMPNAVRVEGHTDNTPIHTTRFASNWELSTARATSVVEFLIERGGVSAGRLSAAGYAEFHPVADNEDTAARFRNRRVDIIILNGATQSAEEPFDFAQGTP